MSILILELKQAPPGGPSRKGMDGEPTEGEVQCLLCLQGPIRIIVLCPAPLERIFSITVLIYVLYRKQSIQ